MTSIYLLPNSERKCRSIAFADCFLNKVSHIPTDKRQIRLAESCLRSRVLADLRFKLSETLCGFFNDVY